MSEVVPSISLGEAASLFLENLEPGEKSAAQPGINKVVRWFGVERPCSSLTGYEIADYAEQLSPLDTGYAKKVERTKAFLGYIRKSGWNRINLATHFKPKKVGTGAAIYARRGSLRELSLSQQGYDDLKAEINSLKKRRLEVIDEMRRAAEDKDFRENAPLQAAREERGHIEGRIIQLEENLKSAVIIDGKREEKLGVAVGDSIVLHEVNSGEDWQYTIVSPQEVDPASGRISEASPMGKAVVGHREGEVVEVVTPAGRMRCQIKQIR